MKRYFIIFICLCVLLCGCTEQNAPAVTTTDPTEDSTAAIQTSPVIADSKELFSDRDKDPSYTTVDTITLTGNSVQSSSKGVTVAGSTVNITKEGTYLLSGTLNGMVVVNADKKEKVQLVLDNASIHSESSAAIYILQADKVFITLADGSENLLSSGDNYTAIDESNIDSVIFSKEDLTLNGTGKLTVNAPAGHGIVSKDDFICTGGTYVINSASHGITAKDRICITNATMQITSGKDGIQGENDEDTALGFVHLESGNYTIRAEGDGISASSYLQIIDGTFDIVTGGGSENGKKQTSDNWGGFMGGMGGRPGGGGSGGFGDMNGGAQEETDSTSIKGLKAASDLLIHGGNFTIDSADDAVHSNSNIQVNGGNFVISTGDDGFHADDTLTIQNGTILINESYEGLEALHLCVAGGEISLTASDDGLNAAGGTDQSGFSGFRGNDKFGGKGGMGGGMGGSSNGTIEITGGTLNIQASGDGIDANGTLTISGGFTTVCGPTQGDTATLDFDVSGVITGGTFIGTGASGMAQTFSNSQQGVIAVNAGNQAANTKISLTDSKGNTVLTHTPELSFAVVILSSPDIVKGESYTLTVGESSGSFEAY